MSEQDGEQITVTIRSVEGSIDKFTVKQTSVVGVVKRDAMKRFGTDPPPGVTYHLAIKRGDETPELGDDKTLLDEDVKDGDLLLLGRRMEAGRSGCETCGRCRAGRGGRKA